MYNYIYCDIIYQKESGEKMPRAKREDGKNARTVASNKYQKNNYDRINILAPLNYKEKVKEYAEKADLSISAYIIKAVNEKIEREALKK